MPLARAFVVVLAAAVSCAGGYAQSPPAAPDAAPARAAKPIALVNAGFESKAPGQLGAPEGWWVVQHAGPLSYTFKLDTTKPHSGSQSVRVENVGPEPFGTIFQKFDASPHRGKTVRFAAWVRTEDTKGNRFGAGAGLNLHAMRGGYTIAHRMMRKDAVRGTTDWTRYEITLNVPNEAEHIEAGLNLFGPGVAWLDDAAVEVMETSAEKP